MYKQAAQLGLRFPFRGLSSVEDLFHLNLDDLDDLYIRLKKQERDTTGIGGLLDEGDSKDATLALQLDIVKDVFATKKAAIEARQSAAERSARKQRILEIIANKQDAELEGKSLDEYVSSLVRKGLEVEIRQAMEALQVLRNDPVQLTNFDSEEDREVALKFFDSLKTVLERRMLK